MIALPAHGCCLGLEMMVRKENTVQKEARETREKVFADRAASSSEAMATYRAKEQALQEQTARLRSERLAREAAAAKASASASAVTGPKRRVRRIVVA
jgi:hypothetical protein